MADESKNGVEAPRAGAAAATSVAASGFYTLAIGSPVMVQFPLETGGVKWKQGHVVEWDAGYTVMYGDGTHGLLQEDAVFTVQRVSRATKVAPGMQVLAPVNAETVRSIGFARPCDASHVEAAYTMRIPVAVVDRPPSFSPRSSQMWTWTRAWRRLFSVSMGSSGSG